MIADPDMILIVNTQLCCVNAITYQDSMIYQSAELEDGKYNMKLVKQLNEFVGIWLQNLINQGHKIK